MSSTTDFLLPIIQLNGLPDGSPPSPAPEYLINDLVFIEMAESFTFVKCPLMEVVNNVVKKTEQRIKKTQQELAKEDRKFEKTAARAAKRSLTDSTTPRPTKRMKIEKDEEKINSKHKYEMREVTRMLESILRKVERNLNKELQREKKMKDTPISEVTKRVGSPTTPRRYVKRQRELPDETFPAEVVPALCGKHEAVLYRHENQCYPFMFKRINKNGTTVYICATCKRTKQKDVKVEVMNGRFLQDPASLDHDCEPKPWSIEFAKRMIYQKTQQLRSDVSDTTPKAVYDELINDLRNDEKLSPEEKKEVIDIVGDLKRHRRAFSRAIHYIKPPVLNLDSILMDDDQSLSPDFQTSSFLDNILLIDESQDYENVPATLADISKLV